MNELNKKVRGTMKKIRGTVKKRKKRTAVAKPLAGIWVTDGRARWILAKLRADSHTAMPCAFVRIAVTLSGPILAFDFFAYVRGWKDEKTD